MKLSVLALLALLVAVGAGVAYVTVANAAPIIVVDDNGPDDYPGQKDLSQLTVDYGTAGHVGVTWNWDDTAWSGNNTGDACTLFDTDNDGKVNYALCATVGGSPAVFQAARLYSCGDGTSDRCDQPTAPISPFASTANASVVANSDPFKDRASHTSGNTCSDTPGCYTADTVAVVDVLLSDVGNTAAKLINVCSYPSQEPNSAPSECVITPNNGFLTIVKAATPNDTTGFTFNLGTGQQSQSGTTSWTINGSGSVQLVSFAPGTGYDLSEVVPTGWNLDSASCVIQSSPTATTGTLSGSTVSDFEIKSGLETICTFTDSKLPTSGSLKITKSVSNPDGATLPASFAGTYDCGTGYTGSWSVAAGASQTISGIPTGKVCSVTETAPAAIPGYTWGTITYTPTTVTIGNATTVEIVVTNSISRDQGYLKLTKSFAAGTSGFTGDFDVVYNCGAGATTVQLAAGESTTVGPFDTGTSCTVTEPTLPSAPSGWTFGTPSVSGSPATIVKGNEAAAVEVTVTNSITRDTGSLKIIKSVTGGPAAYSGSFSVDVSCTGDGGTYNNQSIAYPTPGFVTITGIPTGNVCTVTEDPLPAAPTGYSWGTVTVSGTATIVQGSTPEVTVTNPLSRDTGSLKIVKTVTGTPTGFTGDFGVHAVCTGDGGTYDRTISYTNDGDATNDAVTITGIPTGNTCTVTETSKATVPTGYTWGTEAISPTPSAAITKGGTTTVTVANIVNGRAHLAKTTNGVSSTMAWNFTLSGPYPPGTATESITTPPTDLNFTTGLTPGATYRLCETGLPAGWATAWTINGVIVPFVPAVNNDPIPAGQYWSRVFDPNYVAPPAQYTNDTRCVNFKVDAGTTINIAVDNSYPGGEPRTIGFWKNWNTCTGGNQAVTAEKNGGPAAGWYILNDLLNAPGYTIGDLELKDGSTATCLKAVAILNKSDIVSGKKMASDAAYNLAAQLLAAELNLSAGAETGQAVIDAVNSAQTLLASIQFDGSGSFLKNSKTADYKLANGLAATLDQYNNGFLIP